jgi:hypothetical protein
MGALFMMGCRIGSNIFHGMSAMKDPEDLITANNLGVARKDMGEFVKALQVMMYADN